MEVTREEILETMLGLHRKLQAGQRQGILKPAEEHMLLDLESNIDVVGEERTRLRKPAESPATGSR